MIRAIRVAGGDVARIGDVADILVCKTGIESLRSRSPRLALLCLAARSPCRATAGRFAGLRGCRALPAARRLSD
ncbi:hypothetical protein N4S61_30650 [Burkholderia pseudomallei]|uniref:hypothetical protein n=1 Tax=Burkholderia TaxID=32008 RepID=UPI00016A9668|nr:MULTISPECIES: hypothetical protein [Burkholderia]ANW53832.1 hypothetical protein A7U58_27905 [Burkholderia pseudomallei]ANW59792.1 hypothetical protein A7U59_27840 [Burkholderia pseudomallei]MBM5644922.1 hypothetical protein [Burkholderia pseudomallei]MCS6601724.1 hypothetical protein [Burkholderia pseudomallei]MCT7350334.1 hypothetical protein [Burkholderia pseudomallei]